MCSFMKILMRKFFFYKKRKSFINAKRAITHVKYSKDIGDHIQSADSFTKKYESLKYYFPLCQKKKQNAFEMKKKGLNR